LYEPPRDRLADSLTRSGEEHGLVRKHGIYWRRLAGFGLNSPDIVETEGFSADAPGAALHFLDDNPGGIPRPPPMNGMTASVTS
jgi:hypothetical protein